MSLIAAFPTLHVQLSHSALPCVAMEELRLLLKDGCVAASAVHYRVDRGIVWPFLCRFTVKGGRFCLWIYAVPVSESCTRLIINAGGNFPKPKPASGLKGLKARLSPQPLIRSLLRQLRCTSIPATMSWQEHNAAAAVHSYLCTTKLFL